MRIVNDSWCCGAVELGDFGMETIRGLTTELKATNKAFALKTMHALIPQQRTYRKRYITAYLNGSQMRWFKAELLACGFKEVCKGKNPNSGHIIGLFVLDVVKDYKTLAQIAEGKT